MHLVIAGPDNTGLRPKLQEQSRALGIASRISWPGMLSGDVKWGAFRAADAFVLPSHQENFGIVVAEALACSCPVLISDKVNIWREIQADGAGIVGSDTEEDTKAILKNGCHFQTTIRTLCGSRRSRLFFSRYELGHVAEGLVALIETNQNPSPKKQLSKPANIGKLPVA